MYTRAPAHRCTCECIYIVIVCMCVCQLNVPDADTRYVDRSYHQAIVGLGRIWVFGGSPPLPVVWSVGKGKTCAASTMLYTCVCVYVCARAKLCASIFVLGSCMTMPYGYVRCVLLSDGTTWNPLPNNMSDPTASSRSGLVVVVRMLRLCCSSSQLKPFLSLSCLSGPGFLSARPHN